MERETYFVVEMKVFAFETQEAARQFADKLADAFCDMPEAADYGSTVTVKQEHV